MNNRRALQRLTKRLSARRIAAKRIGKGAKAAVTAKKIAVIQSLMRP